MDITTTQRLSSSALKPLPAASSMTGPLRPGTALPAAAVVQGIGSAAPAEEARGRLSSEVSERRVSVDEGTREFVVQTIDARTKEVLGQTPDRSLLALRAYFDRLADASAARAGSQGGDGLEIVRSV